MNDELKIIDAITRIHDRAGLVRHGRSEVPCGVNLAETHCIDRIGSIEYANVTKLAAALEMTRGAISKICKKLLCKGLIESFQREDNQKEIYFRLTEGGVRVFEEHEKSHAQAVREKMAMLGAYTPDELSIISRFLSDMNRLSYRKLAAQAESDPNMIDDAR
ncbi:MAG: MarR family transcriptional regulator [Capsulimonadaceae bacterium]|nr:MarR family transcriptional regulator [Capsulimonadaceae bacterium]